ncbi:MAG: cobalt-precorrin-5B (C(1))-methyltransferase CbiD, partial [Anaerovoracaceae bacterium]
IHTPKGIVLTIPIAETREEGRAVVCAVRKDSGDDPDVTKDVLVYAKVRLQEGPETSVLIEGGLGVGRVTKPGLACKVGEAAINPVPKKMMEAAAQLLLQQAGITAAVEVEISIPAGVALAKKTFNPKLGIVGGISVLGTTGIVEPMSEQALVDTIKVEINVKVAEGERILILTPGNYGEKFLEGMMGISPSNVVKCSNFIGEALDYAVEKGCEGVLLVGHIGKLAKVAGGRMNTHSQYGDGRMEVLSEAILAVGGSKALSTKIMDCVTTEDAIAVLDEEGLRVPVMKEVLARIEKQLNQRVRGALMVGAVMYS